MLNEVNDMAGTYLRKQGQGRGGLIYFS